MELRVDVQDIEELLNILSHFKEKGYELNLIVSDRRGYNNKCVKRDVRRSNILDILHQCPGGLTLTQLQYRYNHKRKKVHRKTILRDCFFLYNEQKIKMECEPRIIGGTNWVVRINDIKQTN